VRHLRPSTFLKTDDLTHNLGALAAAQHGRFVGIDQAIGTGLDLLNAIEAEGLFQSMIVDG
jgi:hypothetical protein